MITDSFMQAEAKFLNKLKVHNCANFVMASITGYCACFDECFNDRRFFTLHAYCSCANDQEYYSQFVKFCKDPLVYLEVYKFLKTID